MKRLLIQTQLSNYTIDGRFILEADSGWQMCIGRVREMLKLNPDLEIHIMGPMTRESDEEFGEGQLMTDPWSVNPDLFTTYKDRLKYIPTYIEANALATRYNFGMDVMDWTLNLAVHKNNPSVRYDAVYINDPMHLRNFKALFLLRGGYQPKFYVHSHFVDVPSCPKFPLEASLWHGQLESAIKADYNFWQCSSALVEFEREARNTLNNKVVDEILAKSSPWDDGYSSTEMNVINEKNVRFDIGKFAKWKSEGKTIVFVPNRIGGKGRSSDYTNCGKFMFELLPQIKRNCYNIVVIAGNPSQKISNKELTELCGKDGYVSLVSETFNRDEYKVIAKNSEIAVGLYDQDTFGGTAARECIELGCMPLWINCNEYASIMNEARLTHWLAKPDFSDFVEIAIDLIYDIKDNVKYEYHLKELQKIVRHRCSYEQTTLEAMTKMELL